MTEQDKDVNQDVTEQRLGTTERRQSVTEATLEKIGKSLFDSRRSNKDAPEPILWNGNPSVEMPTATTRTRTRAKFYSDTGDPVGTFPNGTLKLLQDWDFHWWTGGAYDSKKEAEDTTYTGAGNYLCAKLDLTGGSGYWSIARYMEDMTTDSDQETRYWCLGKIVDGVYVDWIADDLVIWMG